MLSTARTYLYHNYLITCLRPFRIQHRNLNNTIGSASPILAYFFDSLLAVNLAHHFHCSLITFLHTATNAKVKPGVVLPYSFSCLDEYVKRKTKLCYEHKYMICVYMYLCIWIYVYMYICRYFGTALHKLFRSMMLRKQGFKTSKGTAASRKQF